MTKTRKLRDPASGSLTIDMKKIHKRISTSVKTVADCIGGIDAVDDDARKEKVHAISNKIFDLTETLHDVDLIIDEIAGDDLLGVDPGEFDDDLDVATGLMLNFEQHLKNFHKTFYDKATQNDLKLLAFEDLSRTWRSLDKTMARILARLGDVTKALAGA